MSGNAENCPYCRARRTGKTNEEKAEELMKWVAVNDAGGISARVQFIEGVLGLTQDQEKAKQLWKQAAKLGSSQAHYHLGR